MISAEDRVAILALYARYNRTIDEGDIDGWVDTFAPDGKFDHPAGNWEGAAQLAAFVGARSAGFAKAPFINMRHWNDEVCLAPDGAAVSSECNLIVTGNRRNDGKLAIVASGSYSDRLENREGAWRFAQRALKLA